MSLSPTFHVFGQDDIVLASRGRVRTAQGARLVFQLIVAVGTCFTTLPSNFTVPVVVGSAPLPNETKSTRQLTVDVESHDAETRM